jgi:cytochrome d ubiquinol oxidase subunit II
VGILDWYTVLMGVLVLATLSAHGALFLAWKTGAALQGRCLRAARALWPAVAVLALAATLATAWVAPQLYRNLPRAPLAWAGTALFLGGLGCVGAGLARERHLMAFLGSCAFITGMLAATAACVWPVMLPSTLNPMASITAHNASGPAGLRAGIGWMCLGLPLVVGYFSCLFWLHRGKVSAPEEGGGY